MVQGTVLGQSSAALSIQDYDKTAKKSGYEAIQKIKQEPRTSKDPWGSTFKNKDNFRNMHIC